MRTVRVMPIQVEVSPPSATTMSSSRSMKSLTSLASRMGWMGRVLAFPHGSGLVLAVLVGLTDGFHPGLELLPEGGADVLCIQDAVQSPPGRP